MSSPRDIHELIRLCVDGDPSPNDIALLRTLLRESAEARELYADYLRLHAMLEFPTVRTTDTGAHPSAINPTPKPRGAAQRTPGVPRLTPTTYALAAAVLLTTAAVALYVFVFSNPQSGIRDPQSDPPVATLVDATGDVFVGKDIAHPGSDIRARTVSIASGSAELLLRNRVGVRLTGAASITVDSRTAATVTRGTAEFNCPPGTEGYTVHIPGNARVVDLGTRFRIRVAPDGPTTIDVIEGEVALLELANSPRIDDSRLTSGQSATVGRDGALRLVEHAWVYATADSRNTARLDGVTDRLWNSAPNDQPDARATRDNLWGTPPADQAFDTLPRPIVWEASGSESVPPIRTRIDDLPEATYDVYLLWVNADVVGNEWDIDARLSTGKTYSRLRVDGDVIETNAHGHQLRRVRIGRVTGTTLAVDVRPVKGGDRSRYAGLAYRRVADHTPGTDPTPSQSNESLD